MNVIYYNGFVLCSLQYFEKVGRIFKKKINLIFKSYDSNIRKVYTLLPILI